VPGFPVWAGVQAPIENLARRELNLCTAIGRLARKRATGSPLIDGEGHLTSAQTGRAADVSPVTWSAGFV